MGSRLGFAMWVVGLSVVWATGCASLFSKRPLGGKGAVAAGPDGLTPAASSSVAIDFDLEDERMEEIELSAEDEELALANEKILPVLAVTGTVTFDIPIREDPRVEQWMAYFMGRGRYWYERWLERSTRYVPLFWSILEQHDIPRDLVFLSMIESGFSTRAYSWAHAAGPWQFVTATGQRYGLKVDFWVDERRDFVKATDAAARHLRDLYHNFGDWHLAMAAYNAGGGKISRAIRATGSRDFWRLSRTRRLRPETQHYVPKLIAAARIGKQPERYGFGDIRYLPPFRWEVLTVTVATDLRTLAEACGSHEEALRDMNPALRWDVTPPGQSYEVRVPQGSKAGCEEKLSALSPEVRLTYRYRRLKEGETLSALAEQYGVGLERILELNRLTPEAAKNVEEIVLPVSLVAAANIPIELPSERLARGAIYVPDGGRLFYHVVRSGDSLWKIAQRHGVTIQKLRDWNRLSAKAKLRIGQRLKMYRGARPVAQKAATREASKMAARGDARSSVSSAQKRGIAAKSGSAASSGRRGNEARRHRVRDGDSLWLIAQRYGTTVARLRKTNGLSQERVLRPGQVLVVE